MVSYIRSDLDFILDQIKIAEQHADGATLFGPNGLIPANNISWGLRTVDGTYNNIIPGREHWGAADQPFPRLLDPVYREVVSVELDFDGPGGEDPIVTDESYAPSDNPDSLVVDPSIRTISNLIVDMSLSNPAAVQKALEQAGVENIGAATTAISQAFATYNASDKDEGDLAALHDAVGVFGVEMAGESLVIPNVAPDEGLSASFNSWFTFFGQFFDHGLDLVAKGGHGTVFIPLQPDDPLFNPLSPATNFMVLTRATVDENGNHINITTPFVDQNQTYTSHPSHQVFLREYELREVAPGVFQPFATGKMLDGANGGLPTWGEVKAQARDLLGIDLTDYHVGNLPLLATDLYGNFIRGPGGFPQVVMYNDPDDPEAGTDLVSGTPGVPLNLVNIGPDGPDQDLAPDVTHLAVRTGHAFLDDIAHNAVPIGKVEDGDQTIGLANPGNGAIEYDNELLDAHFVTGDGRGNENIGLTAVHHVFHAEHNRLMEHTQEIVLAENDLDFLNEWLAVEVNEVPTSAEDIAALVWNGDRLFQAAKFGTEMQYQHLVFEEFARKIQPQIDVFLVPQGYDATINPAIVAEFAHVVYRFGHSMLTETIDRYDPEFNENHITLIDGFLNPLEFLGSGATAEQAAGAIIRGMTRQVGNEIDEFVTGALRNNLLGLPLDLATINLARGRDTGVPSLNAARREFYEATNGNSELKPYESWTDFAGHLKNPASIVNFIAAYGLHDLITGQDTIEGKRDAALTLITGVSTGGLAVQADAVDFLNSTGAWASGPGGVTITGLDDVDLWIGGLAEQIMPFGGMLGSTFNFVFEVQLEKLQNADRFYYLQRLDGLHLFGEMENNSFAAMIMRNTDATHLPSDVFSTPGLILEVDTTKQFNPGLGSADPVGGTILTPLVIRDNPSTPGPDANYLRYTGGDHVVLGGTEGNDTLIASIGDDTLYGDGGDDRLEGGHGNDIINGGEGHDIITDLGGDDNIKGGEGNDVINGGNGANLILGGTGSDFIIAGSDGASEVFAGIGNDFILGSRTTERILGNEGDDWIEHGTFDGAPGDNFDEIFAEDKIAGHDVFIGDGSTDEFIAEGGDDIMVGSAGVNKLEGMSGFDWATYKDDPLGVHADLLLNAFDEQPPPPAQATLDQYGNVEGLSGSQFADKLYGSDVTAAEMPTEGKRGSVLTQEGIDRIAGLQELLGEGVTQFDGGNIILGGGGSDLIQGRGGDDIIDGDKFLDVYIRVQGGAHDGETHKSMTTLISQMFSGAINPGQLQIVREIVEGDDLDQSDDIAVFGDVRENYIITVNPDLSLTVEHATVTDGLESDGTDTLHNIEVLRFADGDVPVAEVDRNATGAPVISDLTPTETQTLTVDTSSIDDPDGLGAFSYQWQTFDVGDNAWVDIDDETDDTFTPGADEIGSTLRVVVRFTDGDGNEETLASAATGPVGDFVQGTAVANTLAGTPWSDVFEGLGGDDTIIGSFGDDEIDGGAGSDTVDYSSTVLGVFVNLAAASDHATGPEIGIDQLIGIENVIGGSGGDVLSGDAQANRLEGRAGNDRMVGGLGDDRLDGGDGEDTADYSSTTLSVLVNLAAAANHATGAQIGTDQLIGIENVIGGTGADTLTGDGASNRLEGGGGNDVINGGAGIDTVSYASATLAVSVSLSAMTNQATGAETGTDQISNVENVLGGSGNDTLRGNAAVNTLEGGVGNDLLDGIGGGDTLIGGVGNDSYLVRAAGDQIVETIGEGTDWAYSAVSYVLTANASIEHLGTTSNVGTAAINLTGNALAQTLWGNDGNNVLDGATGAADTLIGRLGNDTYIIRNAGDTIVELAGEGADTVLAAVSYSLGAGVSVETLRTIDDAGMTAINLAGNEFAQTLVGNAGANRLEGGAGNDVINGGAGIDTASFASATQAVSVNLGAMINQATGVETGTDQISNVENVLGGSGNDTLRGNAAVNTLEGGAGNDLLDGIGGGDTLIGGFGNDTYLVRATGDQVVEVAGQGTDLVYSAVDYALTANADVEYLSAISHVATAAINLTGNAGAQTLVGNNGNNVLNGGGGNDTIDGRDGNDTYLFNTALNNNVVSIVGYIAANDVIHLDADVFAGLADDPGVLDGAAFFADAGATAATATSHRIVYNTTNGALFFDHDGAGGDAAVQFAVLTGAPTLINSAEFVVV